MAARRLQIRENGVWAFWGSLRRAKLRSFRWADDSNMRLIQTKSKLAFLGKGALPVPPEHRERVDRMLRERCDEPEEASDEQ